MRHTREIDEAEIPIPVREAAATLLSLTREENRHPRHRVHREVVAAWVKSMRDRHNLSECVRAVGLRLEMVSRWQSKQGIDIGSPGPVADNTRLKRERVYLQEHFVPAAAPPEPVPEKSGGQFTLRVIEMSGDNKTVEAAVQGLREFLQKRSN